MEPINHAAVHHVPWNKGKLVGQKAPLKQREIWAIRIRLQLQEDARELALFNLAIDSKLRVVRSRASASPRCLPRRARCVSGNRHAAKDAAASPVRDHRTDS